MSNYTKTVDFAAKDTLPSGDSGKIIKGTEFETEFDNISTAIATKADSAAPTFTGTSVFTNLDINGTVQADGAVTVGVDDTGYDVKFFGATTGKSLLWDESADSLIVTGTTTLVGTANLDAVDVDGDMTFGDNNKAIFGAGSDLEIYSDGSKSIIKESGAESLVFQATNINFKDATDTDFTARFITGGDVQLYYDGSEKLATTSTGVDVTGSVVSDGLTVDGDGSFTGSFEISGLSPKIFLSETDTTDLNTRLRNAVGKLQIQTVDDSDSNPVTRFQINHSTGDISFYEDTGTTPKFFWDASAESLGIGTASPSNTLHLSSTSPQIKIEDTNATGYSKISGASANIYLQADEGNTVADSKIDFRVDALKCMVIDSGGDISFYEDTGTTPKLFWDASAESLGIGTASPTTALDARGGVNSAHATFTGQASRGLVISTANTLSNDDGVVYNAQTAGSGKHIFQTGGTERMRIDSSGNVGIGGTPTAPLHVFGGGILGASSTNPIAFTGSGGTNAGIGSYTANSDFNVYSAGTGDIKFVTGAVWSSAGVLTTVGSERMRIDSSGNLLVGTTSTAVSSSTGSVTGTVINNTGLFEAAKTGTVMELNRLTDDGTILNFRKDGTTVGSISVTASATAYNTSSDQRLKENIADADDAGSKVDAIQVRKFDWKADGSHQDYGMVAQELLEVAPEAVSQGETEDDMMGVDYSKLVPMMLKEIQSLRARVAQLES